MPADTAPEIPRQATFREVLGSGEFRAIYAASTLSWIGDYLARAAVTSLVYQATRSVTASAAVFAISFAPWLLGGSLLVSLAERYPYRRVMVCCDLARMMLMGAVALPGLPLQAVPVLLLGAALFSPPFDAARSATLPAVLTGDRYVVGVALHGATAQPAQVVGYFVGSAVAAVEPRVALVLNAATFAASAALVQLGVQLRSPALDRANRTHLLRETTDGFRLVFATPALRALVLLVFAGSLFAVVPEGLAAAWAGQQAGTGEFGWAQGLIMSGVPVGSIIGALMVTRLVSPRTRTRLLRPLAIITPLALVPAILDPPVLVIAGLAACCGFAMGALVPIANGEFVQALPGAFRARAFGVVQAGLQLLQGLAVLATGALSGVGLPISGVVGAWSLGGVALMLMLSLTWPPTEAFAAARRTAAPVVAPPPRQAAATTTPGTM